MPFPSALEAEIARGSLAPDAEPHRGAVGKELTVSGSVLTVCCRAEDCRLLRISIVNFLDQLTLVMRPCSALGPLLPAKPGLGKGGLRSDLVALPRQCILTRAVIPALVAELL